MTIKSKKACMLLVASMSVLSCGSVRTVTPTLEVLPPATEVKSETVGAGPASQATIVVKSPIVPDEPEPVIAAARTSAPSVEKSGVVDEPAPVVSVPVPAAKPAPAPKPAPVKVAEAVPLIPLVVTVKPATPVPTPQAAVAAPATAADAAEAPPTTISPPASAPPTDATKSVAEEKSKPPVSIFSDPSAWLKDPKALLQAKIGGYPLWLVVLVVLMAFFLLVLGFRGRKSPQPPASSEIGGGS